MNDSQNTLTIDIEPEPSSPRSLIPEPAEDTTTLLAERMLRGPAFDRENGVFKSSSRSFADYALDTLRGVGNGAAQAVAETAESVVNIGANIVGAEEVDFNASDFFGENETGAGDMARDVTAFLVSFFGFGVAGKALAGAGIATRALTAGGRAAKYARTAARGFAADFASTDGMEAGLIDLVSGYEGLRHGMDSAASQARDRSDFEGRFLHAVEGLGLGLAVDPAMKGLSKVLSKVWEKGRGLAPGLSVKDISGLEQELKAVEKEATVEEVLHPPAYVEETMEGVAKSATDETAVKKKDTPAFTREDVAGEIREKMGDSPEALARMDSANISVLREDVKKDIPTVKQEAKYLDRLREMVKDSPDVDTLKARVAEDYNTAKQLFRTEDGFRALYDAFFNTLGKALKDKGVETKAVTLERAEASAKEIVAAYGGDKTGFSDLMRAARNGDVALKDVAPMLYIMRNMTDMLSGQMLNMARRVASGERLTMLDRLDLHALMQNSDMLMLASRDLGTHAGRALNSFRYKCPLNAAEIREALFVPPSHLTDSEIASLLKKEGWTMEAQEQLMRDILAKADEGPAAMSLAARSFAAKNKKYGLLPIINEYRINNLLSGPLTHAANLGSNAMKAIWMPLDGYMGSLWSGNPRLRRESAQMFGAFIRYFSDSLKLAKMAFKLDSPILDRSLTKFDQPFTGGRSALSADYLKGWMMQGKKEGETLTTFQEMMADSFGWLGKWLRIPSRLMTAGDELFKQLNYRALLDVKYTTEAMDRGLKGADVRAYVDERLRFAFDETGAARVTDKNSLEAGALEYAREGTWTQDLGGDTLLGAVERAANSHPLIRTFIPFIRTPGNIFRDFVAHTPVLNYISKDIREAFKAGGERAAIAKGKATTGAMLYLGGTLLYNTGMLTGSPPQDPKARAALEATGWQAYSIRIGDTYYSYRRIDPVGMTLGIMADMAALRPYMSEWQFMEASAGFIAAITENLTNKTYMQGLAETLEAATNPIRHGEQYFGRFVSTLIPFSSAARFGRQQADSAMREMMDWTDYLRNTLPGASSHLGARRNWVTGDVVNYALLGSHKNDAVLEELNHLADSVQGAPLETLHGVKLSGEQYSRLLELHGTTRIGGKTLHETLQALIESPGYDVERVIRGDPPDAERGPRATALRRIIAVYRQKAQNELLDGDADLRRLVRQHDYQRAMSRSGAMTADNQEELLEALAY